MTLLHMLAMRRRELENEGWEIRALHVDHGIRRERDSVSDLCVISSLCVSFSVPLIVYRAPHGLVLSYSKALGGTEAAARTLRLRIFRDALQSDFPAAAGELVLTAHHADDRREQMLMSFLQGQDPVRTALAPVSGNILRPFLLATPQLSRADIIEYQQSNGLSFNEDPSNSQEKFRRNYVRNSLLPELGRHFGNIDANVDRLYFSSCQNTQYDAYAGTPAPGHVSSSPDGGHNNFWRAGAVLGQGHMHIGLEELRSMTAQQRRMSFFSASQKCEAQYEDLRIPAEVLDAAFDELCTSEETSKRLLLPGYGLGFFTAAGRLHSALSLADDIKKGYFLPLFPGGVRTLSPVSRAAISVKREKDQKGPGSNKRSVGTINLVPCGRFLLFQNSLNSWQEFWYLLTGNRGVLEHFGEWMRPFLPLILADGKPAAVIAPDFALERWQILWSGGEKLPIRIINSEKTWSTAGER